MSGEWNTRFKRFAPSPLTPSLAYVLVKTGVEILLSVQNLNYFSFSAPFTSFIYKAESTHLHLFLTARSLLSSSVRLNTLGPYLSQQLTLFNLPSIIDEALSGAGALESSRQSSSSTESEGWRCSTGMVDLSGHRNVLEGNKKLLDLSGSQNLAEGQETTKTPTKERVDDEDCNSQGFAWDWEDEGLWGNEISFEGEDKGRERYRDGKRNGSGNRSGEVEMIAPAQIWPLGELIQCRHDQLHSRLFNS